MVCGVGHVVVGNASSLDRTAFDSHYKADPMLFRNGNLIGSVTIDLMKSTHGMESLLANLDALECGKSVGVCIMLESECGYSVEAGDKKLFS